MADANKFMENAAKELTKQGKGGKVNSMKTTTKKKPKPKAKPKPRLKADKVTYFEVEYGDLEEFVAKVYKDKEYSFPLIQECGNDCQHSFKVTGKLTNIDEEDIKMIRSGEVPNYSNDLLLDVLCADGYIEPGEYLVRVCW